LEKKCIQQQQESHKTEHSKQQIVSSINIIKDPTTQTTGIKGKGKEADSPAAAASDNNNTASTITSTSSGDVEEDDPDIVILPINNK
jgi:hypothetical protein